MPARACRCALTTRTDYNSSNTASTRELPSRFLDARADIVSYHGTVALRRRDPKLPSTFSYADSDAVRYPRVLAGEAD